jgi:hypothetical protein
MIAHMTNQLDLFREEGEILADFIFRDVIDAIQIAGGNLGTLDIQEAVSAARERAIDLLNSRFPRPDRNSRKRESRRDRPASQANAQQRKQSYERN